MACFLCATNTTDWILIPGCRVSCDFEASRVADEFIQDADDLFKLRPVVSLFLPAVQHQLVEGSRTVHGWGETITLIYSLYYLDVEEKRQNLWHTLDMFNNVFYLKHLKCIYWIIFPCFPLIALITQLGKCVSDLNSNSLSHQSW